LAPAAIPSKIARPTAVYDMEILERTFEITGNLFNGVMRSFERGITSIFGSANARMVKKLQARVGAINDLEPTYQLMSDAELREQTVKFRERLRKGETLDDILTEAFAVCREGGRRFLSMRHYDVQLIGGMVLHRGAIAEMVTGEGKTLVATLPAYLNALDGKGVHVVTVNDYLARRDMEWMGPLYMGLGLTVGAIWSSMEKDGFDRQKAYDCDITYGTNNEFGFDYLRDNMRPAARGDNRFPKRMQQAQGELNYAIIDEVDNILIDEARTPLIISGPTTDNKSKYQDADKIARQLKRETHFVVNEKDRSVQLTEEGVRAAEKLAGVESFYTAGNMEWPHLIDNALRAHHLYHLDVNYVVKDDTENGKRTQRVVIVDEFTGRLMEGRQWSDGLHQAVEAKEGVQIKEETQTLATITLQNFFKLYKKICGMTGTGMTEANEFWKIYKLDVVAIPTNRPMQRVEHADVIYRSEREKFNAVADEIERINRWDAVILTDGDEYWGEVKKEGEESIEFVPKDERKTEVIPRAKIKSIERKGRPILVGTVSIEKSERLSALLEKRNVDHNVLNAKQHRREAEIIAQAGRIGAVTIATNMAGRGTDIILGGNPETMTWARLQDKYPTRLDVPRDEWDALVRQIEEQERMKEQGKLVKELGGLHVIGTERHDARRIDLQLRGRCGRQGDPGSSRFYLSLEDDLMRIFMGSWVKGLLERMGMQEGDRIESRMVSRRIEAAQKKVEERNFEIRKNLLEYDELMDEQRKRVYGFRQRILDGENCRDVVLEMIEKQIELHVEQFLEKDYGIDTYAKWAMQQVSAKFEGRSFRGMEPHEAEQFVRDDAYHQAESQVQDAIDENLPGEEDDEGDWNWEAITNLANRRWNVNLKERDLRSVGKQNLSTYLLGEAKKSIDAVNLDEGAQFLDADFRYRSLLGWFHYKFGIELKLDDIKSLEEHEIRSLMLEKATANYERKEAEYPVLAGLYRFTTGSEQRGMQVDGQAFLSWARERFEAPIDIEAMRSRTRDEIFAELLHHSQKRQQKAEEVIAEVKRRVEKLFGDSDDGATAEVAAGSNGAIESLSHWMQDNLQTTLSAEELARYDRKSLERKLCDLVEDRYRPEMRRMERQVLLEIIDTSWKDHLLVMDRLKSSIGLVGYAQLDAKVEYKREGMRLFEEMWKSIGEKATDLVFRIEQLNDEFVSSTFVETSATHADAQSTSDIARQQEAAIAASQGSGDEKVEPIRNRGQRVGRNDPCPCGSGRKYKQCCMRKENLV
jgi:preprotein translocase subunit SecA